MPTTRKRKQQASMTLLELLVVVAILSILASFVLAHIRAARERALIAATKAQIKSLVAAIEAYHGDHGRFPIDPAGLAGADIPEQLFAALHNQPTPSLGGGISAPYWDNVEVYIGLLNGIDDRRAPEDGGYWRNATSIGHISHHSLSFQSAHAPRARSTRSIREAAGLPAYLDAWGNAYHYREWASKALNLKQTKTSSKDPERCRKPESYELWSNGPNGINEHGAPDSDDIGRGS